MMFVFRKKQDPKPVVVDVQDQALPSTAQVSVGQCGQLSQSGSCVLLSTFADPDVRLKRGRVCVPNHLLHVLCFIAENKF